MLQRLYCPRSDGGNDAVLHQGEFYNPSAISGRAYGIDAAVARARRTVTEFLKCLRCKGDYFHLLCN